MLTHINNYFNKDEHKNKKSHYKKIEQERTACAFQRCPATPARILTLPQVQAQKIAPTEDKQKQGHKWSVKHVWKIKKTDLALARRHAGERSSILFNAQAGDTSKHLGVVARDL